jgi:hypothetical protein
MKRIKALIGVLVIVSLVYLAWKVIPPYMQNYQFQQEIQSIARTSEYAPSATEDVIRNQVRAKINEIGVPANPESVVVNKSGNDVMIGMRYTVHVDVPVHPFDIVFTSATKNGDKIDTIPGLPNQ